MRVMGIIFTNDASLGDLTIKRTMASIPFGGRYRHVDFALSNLSCAGIRHVGIISRFNYQSLINHVGDGEEWGMELGEGGLEFLTPFAMSTSHAYHGKLESLYNSMDFLEFGGNDEYVVLTDSAVLSNIDLKVIDLALKLDAKGEVADIVVDYVADEEYVASMDILVMKKAWLIKQVKEHIARNLFHLDRDLILGGWQKGKVSVNVYPFEGVAMFNESIEEYFRNSMALTEKEIRADLFGANHPVYTKVRDRVPTYYGEACEIENCIVADGCMLEGEAEDSILFRQVTICPGAEFENCVIMNDTVVGQGADLEYVILDKDVTVRPGTVLKGTPKNPIIIKRGETV